MVGGMAGVGIQMGIRKIDGRGRVTLPRNLRRGKGLSLGDRVVIEETEDGALVRRLRSKRELFDGLKGCITKDNEVESVDPVPLKRLLGAGD